MKLERFKTNSFTQRFTTTVILIIMLGLSAVMLLPYLIMLSNSLKLPKELFTETLELIPPSWQWENYTRVLFEEDMMKSVANTCKILIWVLPIGLFTTSLAAFAFAKMRFRGSKVLFALLLATMMIPGTVTMFPTFLFWNKIGFRDSYVPLILPGCLGNISAMFFLVQYLKSMPNSMIEAAKIEGASYFQIYIHIIFPLCKGAIATQALFWLMAIWNDLLGPILYLDSVKKYPLTPFLASLNTQDSSMASVPIMCAGAVCASIPLILLYLIFNKQVINSLSLTGGVKE